MRHRVYGKHLGRNKDERDNLFRGLVFALFTYGAIETSQSKAKAIKPLIDKIINSAKSKNSKDQLYSFVPDKILRERVISEIIPNLGSRTSGYTQTIRLGTRLGDQTTVVKMSLIGVESLKPIKKEEKTAKLTLEDQKTKKPASAKPLQKISERKAKKALSRSKK